MIAKLRGVVDTIGEDYCVIDVNGVGYLVAASAKTLGRLALGAQVSLLIETIVREDSISLFGFADALEKEWFNTLTKVQGVGAKVCLSILSALSPMQLAQAVTAQDKNSFARANGVGPKLAARLVTELKDKIVSVPMAEVSKNLNEAMGDVNTDAAEVEAFEDKLAARDDDPTKMEDAISALVNLGYQRLEAYKAVNAAMIQAPDADMGTLIRLALKEFAKKDDFR
jgi:Holliday junction DNA helicase RuvA